MSDNPKIFLLPGREKSLLRKHPWIFSGAVQRVIGSPGIGDTVEIFSAKGDFLARGAYSPHSQIRARVWTFNEHESVDVPFFRSRLEESLARRKHLAENSEITAYRVVYGENEGLPGLIIDRYNNFLVCQFLAAGAELWKNEIVEVLSSLGRWEGIYERSDVDVRKKEGLKPVTGLLAGKDPGDSVEITEYGLRFNVDLKYGHKTGFYLDQKDNRQFVRSISAGKKVLNTFSFTGGFGISAMKGGADHVLNIDSSSSILGQAKANFELNEIDLKKVDFLAGDAFHLLRKLRNDGHLFDLVILDPPKLAENQDQIERAARAYKDINLSGIKLLNPGGVLMTFSCSGLMDPSLFQKIVADAALDAGRQGRILRYLSQADDHPVALNFPEGRYLKGLVCEVE